MNPIDPNAAPDSTTDHELAQSAGCDDAGVPTLDTTLLITHVDVVRYIRGTLRSYGVEPGEMADAIVDVQTETLEFVRAGRMPRDVGEWKALAAKVAEHYGIDGIRKAEVREPHEAGLCEEPDAYRSVTVHREGRDPVDTKRFLGVLKEMIDEGGMPEDAGEILWGEADGVPHGEIGQEIGVETSVVDNRLSRMRSRYRARLAALGMLVTVIALMVMLGVPCLGLFRTGRNVAAPAPQVSSTPARVAPRASARPMADAGVVGEGDAAPLP